MVEAILNDYTFQVVAIGASLMGLLSGALGCFTVLRRESLLGDGIAHASLPGVVLAFLTVGSKKLEVLLLGALLTGVLSVVCIQCICRYSKVKQDAALAMVLSVFFGAGLVLLTVSQKLPNANQAGLEKFIYGQASTMLLRDVKIIGFVAVVFLLVICLLWKELKLITFDREYAYTVGVPVSLIDVILTGMIVVTIVIGLQSVGVILMSAMLIAPAIAGKQGASSLGKMLLQAGTVGVVGAVLGVYTSTYFTGIPTGPTIVLYSSSIALVKVYLTVIRRKARKS